MYQKMETHEVKQSPAIFTWRFLGFITVWFLKQIKEPILIHNHSNFTKQLALMLKSGVQQLFHSLHNVEILLFLPTFFSCL
jgi:hypothetical protein